MRKHLATLALGLALLARTAPAQDANSNAPSSTPDNSVTVQNDRDVPVTIFMEQGEFDRRLGTVPAQQTATLLLPGWAVAARTSIQLFVHPENAVEDLASETFSLQPPGRLGLIVPPVGGLPPARPRPMRAVIPPEEVADATLTVDNPRATPVIVYAQREDMNVDVRLGTVPARSRATLRFPKYVQYPDDSIKIFVHPEGGFDLSSETLQVRRGEHLGLRVPPE